MIIALKLRSIGALSCLLAFLAHASATAQDTSASALKQLGEVSTDTQKASQIIKQLQQSPDLDLLEVLEAMRETDAVAQNLYLSLAQTIASNNPAKAKQDLEQFLPRLSEEPNARYWAFRYLTAGNTEKREALLSSMLTDPCLELRYAAVSQELEEAKALEDEALVSRYKELLAAARLPAQVEEIAKLLEDKGETVDLLAHFGFIPTWQAVGPFDNTDENGRKGFETAYQPETDYLAGQLKSTDAYAIKDSEATWKEVSTEAKDGAIDLAAFFEKEKGATAYCYTEFSAASELECEVRIGSPNACKVWVNGQPCIGREVYHSGNQVDQYAAVVKLQAGKNTILVKTCQNEQKEPWAQEWLFQLRFTDSSGLAIQPAP